MLIKKIEALIYISGDLGVSVKELEKLIDAPKAAIRENLIKLQEEYQKYDSALEIIQNGDTFQLVTKIEYNDLIQKYIKTDENLLSQAALETLTIIAYKQPLTRVMVDDVRGINSSVSIRNLLNLGLIKESGKVDEPGMPSLYRTTDLFLKAFGLNNIKQLPELNESESFNQQKEEIFNHNIGLLENEVNNE
ncbi:SMC-Scp complex subunit ScpB [Fructilactobacillus sanfranciscensis]|uniref:SMC-Scp complex subunit ScpB n=1 Tax=Fructilactobacillus sanfranciscensis TaxID=1625 RepID=UPI0006EFB88D|nr:SMC-Scp complex subunit ScpB [Fructilactobacillus sanfranciscensis]KRM80797.1 segregation and condensation protein B [Fructilactobacillus sanfranciscensis DSM 20451]POH19285.1 SMC-Scp complex subunit ScpB [Fructilactobacillus sanfranciscensis]POH21409.1 SMC-Scp complex subunit ScpB [Fructilactobacillus sanfranciscensis DSM 20451]QFX93989.1 SMC-Scp complex subunit ScpB [Fructilactobacillus sanfranciscensis]RDX59073.1 SMC-Scp complex subunit ScpB [Fructilactobacillus sanfranciscensis]